MKKLGLFSLLIASVGFATVGCTSNHTGETAQTSQQTSQTEVPVSQSASTQVQTSDGAASHADPTLQQADPIQVMPAEAPTTVE